MESMKSGAMSGGEGWVRSGAVRGGGGVSGESGAGFGLGEWLGWVWVRGSVQDKALGLGARMGLHAKEFGIGLMVKDGIGW